MLSWWAVAAVLCLPCGLSYHALRILRIGERGQSLVLPCDGSAFRDQEGMVRWEQVEETVVLLRGGETSVAESLRGRVQLPSEEQIKEGNWSLVINSVTPSDEDVYLCIFNTSTLVSSVWVRVLENEATVADPSMKPLRIIDGSGGGTTDLPFSTEVSTLTMTGTTDELTTSIDSQSVGTTEESTTTDESTTTEESTTTDESTTLTESLSVGTTDVSTSVTDLQSVGTTDESTSLLGFRWIGTTDKSTPFSDLEDPKSTTDPPLLENFPWVRVGLIGGVLLVTSLVMGLLGALQQI